MERQSKPTTHPYLISLCPLLYLSTSTMSVESWISFFREVSGLLLTAERRFGIANSILADHLIERFELAVQSCTTIVGSLGSPSASLDHAEQSIVADYKTEIEQLIGHLRSLLDQWKEYRMLLDSTSFGGCSYQAPVVHTGRRGRPKFDVDKEQVEYLLTVSFNWSEIAALLGVSRMTLYRYMDGCVF